jgi:hypothetical protein
MLGEISAAIACAGGLLFSFDYKYFSKNRKIIKRWNDLMAATETVNKLGDTFEVEEIKRSEESENLYTISVSIPAGLTADNLQPLKRIMESNFGGDVNIVPDKYKEVVLIEVNKDPLKPEQALISTWNNIMMEKNIVNKFGESFRVVSANLNDDLSYEIRISVPVGLENSQLIPLKNIIESNLGGDIIQEFKRYENLIIMTLIRRV